MKCDIVEGWKFDHKFDLISAFDVLMHIHTKEFLERALFNIYGNLSSDGYFVWYDAYAKDHFCCPSEAECNGFSSEQMDLFALKAGFKKVYEFSLYKNFFQRKHSVYLYNRFPVTLVKVLEKIIPGKPGNIIKIYGVK